MTSHRNENRLRIVFVGHVDHGKSTLIGRLLHETKNLPSAKFEELRRSSARRGLPIEWSFALDSLQAERDQSVTIDTTRVWFSYAGRLFEIIDAPGHREFIRNMLSGASDAQGAVLVIDVIEGIGEQTQRHAHVLRLLGFQEVVVVINKMDSIGYERAPFERVSHAARKLLDAIGLHVVATIPTSAREGENLLAHSSYMPWYTGATLMDGLSKFAIPRYEKDEPLRLRVQDVYRFDEQRVAVGRLSSGRLDVGDTVLILPSKIATKVRSIERWHAEPETFALAGASIGITFEDPIYTDRGDMITHAADAPPLVYSFHAVCIWLHEAAPFAGQKLQARFGAIVAPLTIVNIEKTVDTASFNAHQESSISQYALIEIEVRSRALLPTDTHDTVPSASLFVLTTGFEVVGCGYVSAVTAAAHPKDLYPSDHLVTPAERAVRNAHDGAVIWMTGLSAAGKSTLAMALERQLFNRGASVFVLDGDDVRSGLNSDLGFAQPDRTENIRRVSEVAALFAEAGMIVIAAFISPLASDRLMARRAADRHFHEVYIRADLATCRARDPKGLYARAELGDVKQFTGISAPYEAPLTPDLLVDTDLNSIDECVQKLTTYVAQVTQLQRVYA